MAFEYYRQTADAGGDIEAFDLADSTGEQGSNIIEGMEAIGTVDPSADEILVNDATDGQLYRVTVQSLFGTGGVPVCLTSYIESPTKFTQQDIHGGLDLLSGADTLNNVTNIVVSKMPGKLLFVVNAGSDVVGSMTVTGTSVNRDTGAETGSDTDTITVDATTTDGSDTDAQSNTRWSFTGAYITSKWFTGSVTISTSDLDISDIDVYHVSFEQFNDQTDIQLQTFDINTQTTNANAWLYAYLYTVVPTTGDKCDISRIASLNLDSGDAIADSYARLRRGALATDIDGTTDGIFVNLFLGPTSQTYFEDLTLKVWARYRPS